MFLAKDCRDWLGGQASDGIGFSKRWLSCLGRMSLSSEDSASLVGMMVIGTMSRWFLGWDSETVAQGAVYVGVFLKLSEKGEVIHSTKDVAANLCRPMIVYFVVDFGAQVGVSV